MPAPRDTSLSSQPPMHIRRTRDLAFYIAAALSGIAAAYVLNEWIRWWDARHPPRPNSTDDKTDPRPDDEVPAPAPEHADPNRGARSLPPLRTHSLPPPPPNGYALSSLATNPDAMTSSTSLHTLSTQDGLEHDGASHSNTSDTDTESFVDVLSPSPPAHVISRRRSFRNHDLFAESHISFSELGSLVAPQNEHH